MKSMIDMVLEHAKKVKEMGTTSTSDGIELLGLPNTSENIGAGNIYITALKIINDLLGGGKGRED